MYVICCIVTIESDLVPIKLKQKNTCYTDCYDHKKYNIKKKTE